MNKIENTMALIGGAALGGLAMYLLDPDMGDKRRTAMTDTASDAAHTTHHAIRDAVNAAVNSVHSAYDSAADTVHDTLHGASKTAKSQSSRVGKYAGYAKKLAGRVAGRVGSAATDFADSLSDHAAAVADHASHLSDRLSELASNAAEGARGTADSAASSAVAAATAAKAAGSSYADRLRSEIYRNLTATTDSVQRVGDNARKSAKQVLKEAQAKADKATGHESHPVATTVGLTTGGVALLAAGAAAMYYLDPVRGRSRRAQSTDQLFAWSRRTGKNARRFGRHVGNQLQGYAAETRGVVRDWQSGETSEPSSMEEPSMPSARPTA